MITSRVQLVDPYTIVSIFTKLLRAISKRLPHRISIGVEDQH